MAHTINSECIGCMACGDSCPTDCIFPKSDYRFGWIAVILSGCCTDCGACVDTCPQGAIEA